MGRALDVKNEKVDEAMYSPLASPDDRATSARTVGRSLSRNQELAGRFRDVDEIVPRWQGVPLDITCGGGCRSTGVARRFSYELQWSGHTIAYLENKGSVSKYNEWRGGH